MPETPGSESPIARPGSHRRGITLPKAVAPNTTDRSLLRRSRHAVVPAKDEINPRDGTRAVVERIIAHVVSWPGVPGSSYHRKSCCGRWRAEIDMPATPQSRFLLPHSVTLLPGGLTTLWPAVSGRSLAAR